MGRCGSFKDLVGLTDANVLMKIILVSVDRMSEKQPTEYLSSLTCQPISGAKVFQNLGPSPGILSTIFDGVEKVFWHKMKVTSFGLRWVTLFVFCAEMGSPFLMNEMIGHGTRSCTFLLYTHAYRYDMTYLPNLVTDYEMPESA